MEDYKPDIEIKQKLKEAGWNLRDLANFMQEPPGTVGARLNGYLRFDKEKRDIVITKLNDVINGN